MSDLKTKNITLNEVCSFLKERDNYIFLTHANPDGDTLGSAFGLAMLLKKLKKSVKILCADSIPCKYSYFTSLVKQDNINESECTVVALDVADRKLLGGLEELYGDRVNLVIDHHFLNKKYSELLYLDASAAANCECIYNISVAMGEKPDFQMALALYTGISTDTGCFRYSNTTARTLRIAADLMETKIDAAEINRIMFETKSKAKAELERKALDGMEFYFGDRCAVVTVTSEMISSTGCVNEDLEGLTAISRSIEGVLIGITLRQKNDGGYKVSVRTYPPIDASEFCKKFGGGGHIRAAGCQFEPTFKLDDVKKKLLKQVSLTLEENCAGIIDNR